MLIELFFEQIKEKTFFTTLQGNCFVIQTRSISLVQQAKNCYSHFTRIGPSMVWQFGYSILVDRSLAQWRICFLCWISWSRSCTARVETIGTIRLSRLAKCFCHWCLGDFSSHFHSCSASRWDIRDFRQDFVCQRSLNHSNDGQVFDHGHFPKRAVQLPQCIVSYFTFLKVHEFWIDSSIV